MRLHVEALEDRAVPAALLRLAVLGDSLSAPYPDDQLYGSLGDRSWAEQLQALRAKKIDLVNVAAPGATSADVLLGGQATAVADLVARGQVDYATLIVGADDLYEHLPTLAAEGPAAFIQGFVAEVTANVRRTLDVVSAAGDVRLVVGNIPDVAITPSYQLYVSSTFGDSAPLVIQATTAAITAANEQIEALAAARGIPVVDLFGLTGRASQPVTVGGVELTNLYAPDFFHPGTVAQGVLGNAVLGALHEGYRVPLQPLRLSDQEILAEAGLSVPRPRPRTYFDVSPYVIFEGNESPAVFAWPDAAVSGLE